MSYQIFDTGSSIRFISDDGFFFLMKHHIRSIRYVAENMLRIDTGCCMHNIYLQADHVSEPTTFGAEHLAGILNQWVTTFLQGYPDNGPGPIE
ncbi:MAG: hypothetical protein ACK4E0_03350 [Chitinophagaceae bacterium]